MTNCAFWAKIVRNSKYYDRGAHLLILVLEQPHQHSTFSGKWWMLWRRLTFLMCWRNISKILGMNDVVNAKRGKLCLRKSQHLLPALVKGDDAQVQLVLRLEHHLGGKWSVSEDFRKDLHSWGGCRSHLVWEKGGVYLLLGHLEQAGGSKGGADAKEGEGGLLCFSVLTMQLLDLPSDV